MRLYFNGRMRNLMTFAVGVQFAIGAPYLDMSFIMTASKTPFRHNWQSIDRHLSHLEIFLLEYTGHARSPFLEIDGLAVVLDRLDPSHDIRKYPDNRRD